MSRLNLEGSLSKGKGKNSCCRQQCLLQYLKIYPMKITLIIVHVIICKCVSYLLYNENDKQVITVKYFLSISYCFYNNHVYMMLVKSISLFTVLTPNYIVFINANCIYLTIVQYRIIFIQDFFKILPMLRIVNKTPCPLLYVLRLLKSRYTRI